MQFREKMGGSFGEWITVVGLSPDLEMDGLQSPFPEPSGYYRPLSQTGSLDAYLAVRARSNPLLLTPEVRGAVRAVRPDLPLLEVSTARDAVIRSMWHVTLFGTVFLVFGAVALFMACVGLYGVMAFATRQRTQEVGIRMALGARRGHVVRLVFRQGMTQLGLGLALGLLLSVGMGLATRSWYYGVSSTDPVVTALVAAVLFLTGMAALLIPARRATGVDPVRALRCD
jgi:ABC-type antimicrobial peptide transport system permease subunit